MRDILRIIVLIITLSGYSVNAQNSKYASVDKHAISVPKNISNNPELISNYLTKPFNTDEQKVRAIFYWVANNFKYDKTEQSSKYNQNGKSIEFMLKYGKGVCQNFSDLVNELCKHANIKSVIIGGYTQQLNKIIDKGHAWNGVFINNKWLMIDATWAAGRQINGRYYNKFEDEFFLVEPSEFIINHMPFDPLWQFSNNPISHSDFYKSNFKGSMTLDFNKELNNYFLQDDFQRMTSSLARIKNCGLVNNTIKTEAEILQRNIETYELNTAVEYVNQSVISFNKWTELYNQGKGDTEEAIKLKSTTQKQIDKSYLALTNIKTTNKSYRSEINKMVKAIKQMQEILNQ
ncbi:MAG: hypothetical protein JXA53_06660 [Bacteroidales bacterium]|nr:hypothetical protein [Bacteroidales bacterium]